MDTKLKNRHKLGVLLVWISIAIAAGLMLAAYPWINREVDKKAKERQDSFAYGEIDNFCTQMTFWPYVLWMEEKEQEAGKVLTPSQVFAPGLLERVSSYTEENLGDEQTASEIGQSNGLNGTGSYVVNIGDENTVLEDENMGSIENYDRNYDIEQTQIGIEEAEVWEENEALNEERAVLSELCQYIDETARNWQSSFRQWQDRILYEVWNEQDLVKMSHSLGQEELTKMSEQGWLSVQMHYNKQGMLDGITTETSEGEWEKGNKQDVVRLFEKSLTESYYTEWFRNQQEEILSLYEVSIAPPSERSYQFTIPAEAFYAQNQEYSDFYEYMENGTFLFVVFVSALFTVCCACLLPMVPSFHLGSGAISRFPLELALIGLGCLAPFGYIYGAALTAALRNGHIEYFLTQGIGIETKSTLQGVGVGLYYLYWFLVFMIGYWLIQCIGAGFRIGWKRYFKERTIIGWILGGVAKTWKRLCSGLHNIDLEKQSTKTILKVVLLNFVVLTLISCLWMFGIPVLILYSIGLFFLLTKYWGKVQRKYEILLHGMRQMANGSLDTEIEEDLGVFESLKQEMQKVQYGFKTAVEEETRSQRMKTELITNVSHDLKTPLTAIVTYINLLKKEDITEEERASYIEVLDNKAMRLKTLIEDLFEVSKAASRTVQLNRVEVDIVSLLKQVRLELSDRLEQSGVMYRWTLPEDKVILMLDSEKTYRIFENLLINIIKYAMPRTRAYIEVREEYLEKSDSAQEIWVENDSLKESKEAKTIGTKQTKQTEEDIESIDAIETIETIEGIKRKEIESIEDTEGINDREAIKDTEGIKDTEDVKDMQSIKDTKEYGKRHAGQRKRVWITMKNISANEIQISPEELTERFVCGDSSRNTEGSGLGLAIAKNFVEMQDGTMEVEVEADLFKVSICWEM